MEILKDFWKYKFKWQLWVRLVLLPIVFTLVLVGVIGDYSMRIADWIGDKAPNLKAN